MRSIICALMARATTTAGAAEEIGPTSVFFTGNDLHEYCQRGDPFRLGYVAGLWDLTSHAAFVVDGKGRNGEDNRLL